MCWAWSTGSSQAKLLFGLSGFFIRLVVKTTDFWFWTPYLIAHNHLTSFVLCRQLHSNSTFKAGLWPACSIQGVPEHTGVGMGVNWCVDSARSRHTLSRGRRNIKQWLTMVIKLIIAEAYDLPSLSSKTWHMWEEKVNTIQQRMKFMLIWCTTHKQNSTAMVLLLFFSVDCPRTEL